MQSSSLFDPLPSRAADQPGAKPKETKAERIARERMHLEDRLASGDLDDTRTRVAFILNQYPSCRNSDVELAIRYWRMFHPDDVGTSGISYDALRIVTPMNSIIRARATIQNTFGLFIADDAVAEVREERQQSVRKKQLSVRTTLPFVQVYSDESGKTDRHYVVGSLWINDADDQVLKLWTKLNNWRKTVEWTAEIHFAEITSHRKESYLDFVRQAMQVSEYIGFKAVVLSREDAKKRPTEDAIHNLYYRLVVDGIRHEVASGRFALPRAVAVFKDEDQGADKLYLLALRDKLRAECPRQFDNQLEIAGVTAIRSSSNVLMQLADVFAGSVNRIVNRGDVAAGNHKDYVAEGVMNLLGVDPRDIGGGIARDFVSIVRL